jgi:hypothetical protein
VDKEAALAQLLELSLAATAYEEALASGDSARMQAAREVFEQTQRNLGSPPAVARVASMGVRDATRMSGSAQQESVLTYLEAAEGEGLARQHAIGDWREREFEGQPERFAHALTSEERFFLDHYAATLGSRVAEPSALSADQVEEARRMFGAMADPLGAYANWRNRQTIIAGYAWTAPDTAAYLGSLYRATRDLVNPPHFLAERGYQAVTGEEAFTGEHTGRLRPIFELAMAWAMVKLTSFVVGRSVVPGRFVTNVRTPGTRTKGASPAEAPGTTTVVSPSGLRVTIKDGRPVAWEWNIGAKGQRGSGYRDVTVSPGNHRGHVKSVGEGAGRNVIDDGPLNVVEQTPVVNLSNVRRFESWRIRTAQGEYVKAELRPDGLMRVQIPSRKIDVVFDPNALTRFPDNWFLQPGSTWE